jgi:hypothetical protein
MENIVIITKIVVMDIVFTAIHAIIVDKLFFRKHFIQLYIKKI